ncbi:putative flavoprotein involved in K+ transport [Arboricoccus pini]|uniref:Putative flavoprotein involved in K+ transport n=1 Tax=Arboricoccus pini TaxID=1963835 RepID=A0A212RWW3_9PROT|nr:NAD(P)/FAD-dependent oxidoreductase [Arboricoccus pini]SNB77270.1 putative flavoprotein involved in K+ transport [Arboricoccus pini]
MDLVSEGAAARVDAWLASFGDALERGDAKAAAAMFEATESFWRDLVAFSWNIITVEGPAGVEAMLDATLGQAKPRQFRRTDTASEKDGIVEGWFTFETEVARGLGHLRLKGDKAFTLLSTMTELKGHEEKKGRRRIMGAEHGVHPGRKNWREKLEAERAELGTTKDPYVLIVGGGQGGLALGARLRRLGVPTIIVDKYPRPGDQWRSRYKSLCLHDPVWYDHMPYLPFPDDWPVYTPKDKMGDWLEMYARVMELNFWGSTTCKKASFDEAAKTWSVVVEKDGKEVTLRPRQLVLATGMSGVPNVPKIKGAERFKGVQHHSSQHPSGEAYRGKKCVVIGANNSAHDIAADLWEHGADVTMVQRSSTHVVTSRSLFKYGTGVLYSEDALERGITTDKADLLAASMPYRIMHRGQIPIYEVIKKEDADLYDRLTKAGFMLDFGDDESGLSMKYLRRGSGYYIDVGASDLVADGKIKLKSRVGVDHITEDSVVLTDGTELPADLIVYATGYGSMNGWAARLISQEVADKVGKCWGLGSATTKDPGPWEGEQRNMWKPTQQEGLWFQGGNLHQARHYSQFLSLQLKARMEGIPTPVYGMTPAHHLA